MEIVVPAAKAAVAIADRAAMRVVVLKVDRATKVAVTKAIVPRADSAMRKADVRTANIVNMVRAKRVNVSIGADSIATGVPDVTAIPINRRLAEAEDIRAATVSVRVAANNRADGRITSRGTDIRTAEANIAVRKADIRSTDSNSTDDIKVNVRVTDSMRRRRRRRSDRRFPGSSKSSLVAKSLKAGA